MLSFFHLFANHSILMKNIVTLNREYIHLIHYCIDLQGHYENMPMQYTEIFYVVRNENFQ